VPGTTRKRKRHPVAESIPASPSGPGTECTLAIDPTYNAQYQRLTKSRARCALRRRGPSGQHDSDRLIRYRESLFEGVSLPTSLRPRGQRLRPFRRLRKRRPPAVKPGVLRSPSLYRIPCHETSRFPPRNLTSRRIERSLDWRRRRFASTLGRQLSSLPTATNLLRLLIPSGRSTAATSSASRRTRDERLVADARPACLHATVPILHATVPMQSLTGRDGSPSAPPSPCRCDLGSGRCISESLGPTI
jgi:hypothetical protein